MAHTSKFKQSLWAQAALARSSRNLSPSQNTNGHSTPLHSSKPSTNTTPAVSPFPLSTPYITSDEENEIQENIYDLPDTHIPNDDQSPELSLEEEEDYHTDDDLSKLEDDELEESLKQQREEEHKSVKNMDLGTRNMFHTLMRDVSQKQWEIKEWKVENHV